MRLKSLEMIGFKSFAQKTLIELNPGITAIVGPNGCGKSNIVDALRWAMGEQSARNLRGHQMEDVVFSGSDTLPPTGMAEVSITFDNEDGRGPAEYGNFSEIMVTRRLFRSGESDYAINKVPCRLKDVIELFLGTGVGSKAYSIVEQGRVDELVNSKPEERRALIEEAAGTSKYKSRKLVAERKLERTQQNLLRVSDIVREIERQIRTMELQAKKAERYRALKAELRDKDLACAALQRRVLNEEIIAYETQLADAENHLIEHLASLDAKEAESEAVRLSLMEADEEIGAQQEKVYQHKVQIQAEEQRTDFYNKDLSQLNHTETEARAALSQLEDKLKTMGQEIEELNKAKESFVQLSLFEQTFLREKEQDLEKLQAQIQSLQSELDKEKEALIESANQIAYLNNDAMTKEKRRAEIEKELARSQEEHSAAADSLELCEQRRRDTKKSLEASLEQARKRTIDAAQMTASIQSLGKATDDQERRINILKEQIQESRSRLISLEDLQRNYEGCQEGVRAIMLKRQQEPSPNGIYGLVAEVIEAPESYEKALTAVLGDRLQYVIVKGHEEGLEAIEYLKREASGRGSFIPLQLSRRQHQPLPVGEAEVIAPLLEMISVKDGYRDVAEYLLSDVVVVRDLKAGIALRNRNGFYSTMVTPDGEVIDPMGIVTGGSGASLEGSFLSQRRRIRELRSILGELDLQLQVERVEVAKLKRELEEAETKKSLFAAEIHRLEVERVGLEHAKLSADQELARLTQTVQAWIQAQIADIQLARAELETSLVEAQRTLELGRTDLQELENRLHADRQRYKDISMRLAEIEESIKELRPLGQACQEEKSRLQLALAEKRLNLQHLANNIREKYDVECAELNVESSENSLSREQLLADIDELRGRLERMGEVNLAAIGEYEELTTRFQFINQQKQDLEKSIADLQQTITKLNRVCRLRFKESFEEINEKFQSIFPRLFRGGKAKLVLTDETDYLETGVEIVVQPPGKKLQSITLLSGGEKALTAVSLLFAIFLTKPSPFCFLDEVDAPLDDANIDRFNEMINEMSRLSQFVLVTHNKKTMQAAEVLYGITMAEPGISKVVSVRMS